MADSLYDRQGIITDTTSSGLSGLPHFRTSRVSMNMWEPVWQNLYTVDIQLPAAIRDEVGVADTNLLLEGVTKVTGLETNKVPAANSKQRYKIADRRFADAGPENTYIDVSLEFEVNVRGSVEGTPDMYTLKILRKWNDLIYDPLSGRMGLKAEYVAPYVKIIMHDKAYNPFWEWELRHVWPSSNLIAPSLDFSSKNSLYKVTGYKLACDYWDEHML